MTTNADKKIQVIIGVSVQCEILQTVYMTLEDFNRLDRGLDSKELKERKAAESEIWVYVDFTDIVDFADIVNFYNVEIDNFSIVEPKNMERNNEKFTRTNPRRSGAIKRNDCRDETIIAKREC